MKIQLVKEVKHNKSTYYITVDGSFKAGSICDSLADALEMYYSVKESLTGKRTEVLMQEDI
jgi:hypothetical protein